MKNKKNTIRLTESELKRMIVESAKNIISELDWKTYANAYKKARETETPERYRRFKDAAADAFNREYGYDGKDGSYNMRNGYYKVKDERGYDPYLSTYSHNVINSNGTEINGFEASFLEPDSITGFYGKIPAKETQYVNPKTPNAAYKAKEKGDKEIDKYRNGKYKYTKDKGWHLPESIISKAINESFKSIIKEQNNQTWRGVKGTFVTEDGYVEYKGKRIDYDDLEDWLYEEIQEYTHNTGERYIEGDVLFYTDVIDAYVEYME